MRKEEEITGASAAQAPSASCLNCGFAFASEHKYCAACGQETNTTRVAFGDLVREAWAEFVQIDSRLVRTLFALLFKPGFLTREYISGKRVRYLSPFKMYLVVAALFFALASWVSRLTLAEGVDPVQIGSTAAAKAKKATKTHTGLHVSTWRDDSSKNKPKIRIEGDDLDLSKLAPNEAAYEKAQAALPPYQRDDPQKRFLIERAIHIRDRWDTNRAALFADVIAYFPNMMFFLLPLYALLLKLLYMRREWLFIEHLVFALHIHTMFFLICGLSMALSLPAAQHVLGRVPVGNLLPAALWFGFVVYGFVAARTVYRQGIFKTLLKSGFLVSTYFFVVTVAVAATVIYALARI